MSPPASVTITQLEPVVFLRGQSSSGEDARGRRRPVNIDAPPSQLRGLVTLYLPKPSKIKEITVSLKGTAKTDWPEGIGPNRVELVEEMTIFHHTISLYNAKHDKAISAGTRPRSNSVGPGIGLQDDVDWEYAAAAAAAAASSRNAARTTSRSTSASSSRQANGTNRKDDERPKSSGANGGSGGSNLARQIAGAAAKAGTAMIPPTLRPDMGLNKSKDSFSSSSSSRSRPTLQRTGSGTTEWTPYATSPDSNATTPAQSPSFSRGASAASSHVGTPALSYLDVRPPHSAQHQDLSRWHDYFESQGHERPPLYAPRSAPLQGYDAWPTQLPLESPSTEQVAHASDFSASTGNSVSSNADQSTSVETSADANANANAGATSSATHAVPGQSPPRSAGISTAGTSAPPGRSILHTQPPTAPRAKDQVVRFDPQSRVDNAPNPNGNGSTPRSNGQRSTPSSRRNSVELHDNSNKGSKGKLSTKSSSDSKSKKPGLKTLINGLLKEPVADHKPHSEDAANSDSKEFKRAPTPIPSASRCPPTFLLRSTQTLVSTDTSCAPTSSVQAH